MTREVSCELSLDSNNSFWTGIISERNNSAVHSNIVFKAIAHIITIVGLISSIMGIVLGWDEFVKIIVEMVQKT